MQNQPLVTFFIAQQSTGFMLQRYTFFSNNCVSFFLNYFSICSRWGGAFERMARKSCAEGNIFSDGSLNKQKEECLFLTFFNVSTDQ